MGQRTSECGVGRAKNRETAGAFRVGRIRPTKTNTRLDRERGVSRVAKHAHFVDLEYKHEEYVSDGTHRWCPDVRTRVAGVLDVLVGYENRIRGGPPAASFRNDRFSKKSNTIFSIHTAV